MNYSWNEYYKLTKNRLPSPLLVQAITFINKKETALDLGTGALVDSKYLLTQGFEVVAVDKEKPPEEIMNDRFKFVQNSFRDYDFPRNTFDLINAQFALPFNGKESFNLIWERLLSSLKLGGIFVGQFFGLEDEWNVPDTKLVFHSKEQVEKLLNGLEVLELKEINKDGKLANGRPKHWHFFNVIARKKA
jgi:hypothetical protein